MGRIRSRRLKNTLFPVSSSLIISLGLGLYQTIEILEPQLNLPPPLGIGSPLISTPRFDTSCIDVIFTTALGTTVLSFLLVFRTTKSYGRFDDAHKLWGSLKARCRDTLRLCGGLFPQDPGGRASFQAVARWLPAYCQCLRVYVGREAGEDLRILQGWLLPNELEALSRAQQRPQFCLQVVGEVIRRNVPEHNRRVALDENVRVIVDILGGCERVYRKPIPSEPEDLSYSRQTSRFLSLWAFIFPFAFWHEVEWAAVVFAPVLTFLLFAIDDIGEQYDRPFTAMPLALMCTRITRDCQEVVRQAEQTRALAQWAVAFVSPVEAASVSAWAVAEASEAVAAAADQAEETLLSAALRDRSAEEENRPTPLEMIPAPLGFGAPLADRRAKGGGAASFGVGGGAAGAGGAWPGAAGDSRQKSASQKPLQANSAVLRRAAAGRQMAAAAEEGAAILAAAPAAGASVDATDGGSSSGGGGAQAVKPEEGAESEARAPHDGAAAAADQLAAVAAGVVPAGGGVVVAGTSNGGAGEEVGAPAAAAADEASSSRASSRRRK